VSLIFCPNNVFNHSLHMLALILMGPIKVYPSLWLSFLVNLGLCICWVAMLVALLGLWWLL
jgi:hypothetical protein